MDLAIKKKETLHFGKIHGTRDHHVKQTKPDSESQFVFAFVFNVWNLYFLRHQNKRDQFGGVPVRIDGREAMQVGYNKK